MGESATVTHHRYGDDTPERQAVDVWRPATHRRGLAVMLVHGGGLRSLGRQRMNGVAAWLGDQGFVVLNIGYRLVRQSPYPAALHDVLAAVAWWRRRGDGLADRPPARPVLLGLSAGGFLAMTAASTLGRSTIAAVVSVSGPTTRYPVEQGLPIAEGTPPSLLASPLELAGADTPPLLAIHSRQDGIVPAKASRQVVDRLRSAGNDADLMTFDARRTDHGIWRDQDAAAPRLLPSIESRVLAFLGRLDPTPDSPSVPRPVQSLDPVPQQVP